MRQKQGRSVGGDGGDKVSKDSFERRGCPPLPADTKRILKRSSTLADTSTLPRAYVTPRGFFLLGFVPPLGDSS